MIPHILAGAWPSWLHWLESTFFPESGRWYALGSSWAGATAVFSGTVAAFVTYWRHHECHQQGCRRRGKYAHGHYKLCAVHHPHVPSDGKIEAHHIEHLTRDGTPSSTGKVTTRKPKEKAPSNTPRTKG